MKDTNLKRDINAYLENLNYLIDGMDCNFRVKIKIENLILAIHNDILRVCLNMDYDYEEVLSQIKKIDRLVNNEILSS